jgi:hypothetical protein
MTILITKIPKTKYGKGSKIKAETYYIKNLAMLKYS